MVQTLLYKADAEGALLPTAAVGNGTLGVGGGDRRVATGALEEAAPACHPFFLAGLLL